MIKYKVFLDHQEVFSGEAVSKDAAYSHVDELEHIFETDLKIEFEDEN